MKMERASAKRSSKMGSNKMLLLLGGVILSISLLLGLQGWLRYKATIGAGKRIVLWHSYIDKEAEALKSLVAKFNNDPQLNGGYNIEILSVSFNNFSDKLTNSLPRGQGPDLFIYGHDRMEDWLSKNLLAPVDFWISPMELEDFTPESALNTFIRNKRLYALPLSTKNLAIYYRKFPKNSDLENKISGLQKSNSWTMKNFIALARQYTRDCPNNKSRDCYGLGYQADDAYHHAPWLHAYGGHILTKTGEPSIVTPQGIKAAELAYKLAGNHSKAVVPKELSYPLMVDMFQKGEISMVISGPWFMSQLKEGTFGVTTFPTLNGNPINPFLTIEGIYMSAKAKNRDMAYKVMDFLAKSQSSFFRAKKAGQLPVRRSVNRLMKNDCAKNNKCFYNTKFFGIFSKISKTAVIMPATKEARIIWPPYTKALAAIIKRGVNPTTALKEAEWEINKYLGACLRRSK
jgi:arabinogalactan oligomer / maltooligosaccharide transport system substrate-binding protein